MQYGIVMATKDYLHVQDFIDEHLKIGFDRLVIYDGSEKTHEFSHPRVIIRRWDKPHTAGCLQYNEYFKEFGHEKDWMSAMLDEDEIYTLKGTDNIHIAMKPYEDYPCLGLNWQVFGPFIEEGNSSNKLTEKFLFHAPNELYDPNGHNYIKSIAKHDAVDRIIDPHAPILKKGLINRGVQGNKIIGSITRTKDYNSMYIRHYHFQDRETYIWAKTREIPGRETRTKEDVAAMWDQCVPLCNVKD